MSRPTSRGPHGEPPGGGKLQPASLGFADPQGEARLWVPRREPAASRGSHPNPWRVPGTCLRQASVPSLDSSRGWTGRPGPRLCGAVQPACIPSFLFYRFPGLRCEAVAEPQVTCHLGLKAEGRPHTVAPLSETRPCSGGRRVRDKEPRVRAGAPGQALRRGTRGVSRSAREKLPDVYILDQLV